MSETKVLCALHAGKEAEKKKSFAIRAFHLRHEDNKFRLTFLLSLVLNFA